MEPADGAKYPTLILEAMKGIGGVFLVRVEATGELVGIICVFVDDVLAAGESEVNLRVSEHVLKTWKGKLQGMITRGAEVQCQRGSLEVQVKSELVFIGIQMLFKGSAVMMSQQRWVATQLNIRGYLHLKGTPCLPQVEEGKYSKGSEDQCNPTLIKKAQREMGALMWLATKTRPDIASTCEVLSTLVVLRPDLVLAKATSLWKYVRHTMFYGMTFTNSDDRTLALESDASFGSGASRSRTGYAIKWGPCDHVQVLTAVIDGILHM